MIRRKKAVKRNKASLPKFSIPKVEHPLQIRLPYEEAVDAAHPFTLKPFMVSGKGTERMMFVVSLSARHGALKLSHSKGIVMVDAKREVKGDQRRLTFAGAGKMINKALAGIQYIPDDPNISEDAFALEVINYLDDKRRIRTVAEIPVVRAEEHEEVPARAPMAHGTQVLEFLEKKDKSVTVVSKEKLSEEEGEERKTFTIAFDKAERLLEEALRRKEKDAKDPLRAAIDLIKSSEKPFGK